MKDDVPDQKVSKQSLAYRAKYGTKVQAPRQNWFCWQIVPHCMNRGGEPIRNSRAENLAGDILSAGYHHTEATVDSVVVGVDVDSMGNLRGPSLAILSLVLHWNRITISTQMP